MKLLEIKHLNKSYGDKKVLKDINLSITSGKIIGLLGKNGTGKSTLIKLINDLLRGYHFNYPNHHKSLL